MNYLTPLMGKQVHVVLNNESLDGVVYDLDMDQEIITLKFPMAGEWYIVRVMVKFIQAIVVKDT